MVSSQHFAWDQMLQLGPSAVDLSGRLRYRIMCSTGAVRGQLIAATDGPSGGSPLTRPRVMISMQRRNLFTAQLVTAQSNRRARRSTPVRMQQPSQPML